MLDYVNEDGKRIRVHFKTERVLHRISGEWRTGVEVERWNDARASADLVFFVHATCGQIVGGSIGQLQEAMRPGRGAGGRMVYFHCDADSLWRGSLRNLLAANADLVDFWIRRADSDWVKKASEQLGAGV